VQKFDEAWPRLDAAFVEGVLPAQYFTPPPAREPDLNYPTFVRPEVLKILPAPANVQVVFVNGRGDEQDRKRPVAYAVVQYPPRKKYSFSSTVMPPGVRLEPLVSVEGHEGYGGERWDTEYGPDESLYLASEYAMRRIDYSEDWPSDASWIIKHDSDETDNGEH